MLAFIGGVALGTLVALVISIKIDRKAREEQIRHSGGCAKCDAYSAPIEWLRSLEGINLTGVSFSGWPRESREVLTTLRAVLKHVWKHVP